MGMFGSALKKIATPENLYLLGATLKDIGDGGSENFLGAQQMFQGRRDKAEATAKEDAQRQALADLVSGINGQPGVGNNIVGAGHGSVANPGEYGGIGPGMDGAPMGGRQPGLFGGQRAGMSMQALAPQFLQYAQKTGDVSGMMAAIRAGQPDPSRYIEGPDGIYEVGPQGPKLVKSYPAKPNTTPGQINPETGRWEWAPGYLESQGSLSGVRAGAVAAHRAPRVGRAGGGGQGGGSGKPWEKYKR